MVSLLQVILTKSTRRVSPKLQALEFSHLGIHFQRHKGQVCNQLSMAFHQSWVPNHAPFWSRKWVSYSRKALDFQRCSAHSSTPWFGATVQLSAPRHTSARTSKRQVPLGAGAQPTSPSKRIPALQEAEVWVYATCTSETCQTGSCINRTQGKKASSSIATVSLAKNHNCFVWKLKSVCKYTPTYPPLGILFQ